MSSSSGNRGFPAGNPIANALVIVVGALVIGASVVLGFVAFVVLSSVLVILAAIVGIRLWWFKRKLQKAPPSRAAPTGVIEGEFHVVVNEQDDSKP